MEKQQISWMTIARILKAFPLLGQKSGASARELAAALGMNQPRDIERTFLPALERIGIAVEDLDEGKPGISHRYRLMNTSIQAVRIGLPQAPIPQLAVPSGLSPRLDHAQRLVLEWMLAGGGVLEEAAGISQVLDQLRGILAQALGDPGLAGAPRLSPGMARGLDSMFSSLVRGGKDYSGDQGRYIIPLAEAIQDRRICTITYRSPGKDQAKTWDIWPLYMVENSGGLYILALADKYQNKYLPLAVDRIEDCQVLDRSFEYPADFDPQSLLESAFDIYFDEIQTYRIRFDAETAPYIRERRWAADQALEDQADGSLILGMQTRGYPDIKRWVMGYGSHARVLEPRILAEEIREEARRVLESSGA